MRPARLLPPLFLLVSALLSLPLVAGFFNRFHPALDSFAHFRLHLAALLGLAALALLTTRFRREGAVALLLAVGAFAATPGTLVRDLIAPEAMAEAKPADRAVYRLLHVNARFDNAHPEWLLSLIGRLRPDVVTVNEVSAMWREKLGIISYAYPHVIVCDAHGVVGGVAILSRRPFVNGRTPRCADDGALAVARIDFSGQAADIAALHLHWPWPFGQPAQLSRLTPALAELSPAALLAGDFNATRWSAAVDRVARDGRLRLAGPGSATWLHWMLPAPLRRTIGLGIDHVMAGADLAIHAIETVDDVASDHLPVLTEFSLRPLPKRDGDEQDVQTVRLAARG